MSRTPATLVDLLRERSLAAGDARGFTFLADAEREAAAFTWGELDARARAIAVALAEDGLRPGDRALLLYPPGLEFIAAFFGALYAGAVAVPCYPPSPAQLSRTAHRVAGVVDDAEPAVVLCGGSSDQLCAHAGRIAPGLAGVPWIETDALTDGDGWCAPPIGGASLAFLQYTSGSTNVPRGVMVTHTNLLHNLDYLRRLGENGPDCVSVSWLPVIHDMGLIEGVLQPVFAGYPAVLMAPAAFLQRPLRWLRAISDYHATNSGGPNFAYDLCVRKTTPEQRESLDLSSWRVAYNGAEPIRADTLRAFHAAFAPRGLRWNAFYPVYGLAEATLMVSSGGRAYEPVIRRVDGVALREGRVVCDARGAREVIASGRVDAETTVRIVDPERRVAVPDGTIGEIWVRSASVACGYWRRRDETEAVFGGEIADEAGVRYLRTGDLGALMDGELFVVGRIKDMLIVRGVKYYPQDLERTVECCHAAVRPGCTAAFAVDESDGGERAAMVVEVDERSAGDLDEVACAIRESVLREHGLMLHAVALLVPGTIPKTTSGKIRRSACARGFLDETLSEIVRWPGAPAGVASQDAA
jgi:acyl-CoA synthetase (AMP-forming)/AMP-acid ligase II